MAEVEPPNDGNLGDFRHPSQLKNPSPVFVLEMYTSVIQFLQSYGWYLLFGTIIILFAKRRLWQYLASRPEQQPPVDLHRYDSAVTLQRQEGFEKSRRTLQEKYDADAARFAEEQKQKEEEKRKQKIADWDNHVQGKGYRNKYKPPEDASGPSPSSSSANSASRRSTQSKKPVYRAADYNPLTGTGGGGGGYRPAARRGGGG